MDLLCVGMYRSCSTWQYDVVAHLLERHRGGRRLGYLTGDQYAALAAREPGGGGWRVLKSHEEHPAFAEALAEGRALAVYAFRDMRDVVFSMLHKRRVGFREFVRQGMIHQILANDRFWTARPGLLIQRYGDLMTDPVAGVEGLAAHLGIALAGGEAAEIASEYAMEANRRRADELARRLRERGIDVADPTNAQHHDGRTLLHWNHLRQGRIGGWRDEATPVQRAVLRRIVASWLVERGYESGTTWAGDGPGWPGTAADRLRWELALAEGRLRCAARCAGLRYPRAASWIKGLLGLSSADPAGPRPSAASPRRDRHPAPHWRFRRWSGRSHARPAEDRPFGAARAGR